MTLNYFTKGTELTGRIITRLTEAQDQLGLAGGVYWGLETLVPTYPAVLVASDPKDRDLATGGTHRWQVILRCSIVIVHQEIQSSVLTRQETEEQAEMVEDFLHQDFYLKDVDGTPRVIFGMVTRSEPGQMRLASIMTQATRLRYEALSRQEF